MFILTLLGWDTLGLRCDPSVLVAFLPRMRLASGGLRLQCWGGVWRARDPALQCGKFFYGPVYLLLGAFCGLDNARSTQAVPVYLSYLVLCCDTYG